MLIVQLFIESLLFAINSLKMNLMRTILSLLGVTIGIFVIIAVLSLVDSMERNVKDSFKVVGEKVVYVVKWPLSFEKDYPWWKYYRRPSPSFTEFKQLKKKLTQADAIAISATKNRNTLTYESNSMENVAVQGVSYEFDQTIFFSYEKGRYFTQNEISSSRKVAILGFDTAKELFDEKNPVGKSIKIGGISFNIIGVFKKQGNSLIGMSTDEAVMIPYNVLASMVSTKSRGFNPFIVLKCRDDSDVESLEGEVIGAMRAIRRLKPRQEDNFSINRIEMLVKAMDAVFKVMGMVGWFIGGFAMLVGGFGIANIMFVSVKERTHLIGIKKSLGAKNSFILLEFLFEAILLSLLGGVFGVGGVLAITFALDQWMGDVFAVHLSLQNMMIGLGISATLGTLAGILPAMAASALNPVDAIRSK